MIAWHPWARPTLEQASRDIEADPAATPVPGLDEVIGVLFSGDGGWAEIDRHLARAFAASGVPVVGVSTLRYFWRERAPHAAARELDALLARRLARWQRRRVWLLGFSFGADVLPTLVAGLSAALRTRIAQLVLLSPSPSIAFEIGLENYVNGAGVVAALTRGLLRRLHHVAHYDPLPRVAALAGQPPVVCYYGTHDRTLCSERELPPWVVAHRVPGGHHLGRDYATLARRLLRDLAALRGAEKSSA